MKRNKMDNGMSPCPNCKFEIYSGPCPICGFNQPEFAASFSTVGETSTVLKKVLDKRLKVCYNKKNKEKKVNKLKKSKE
jgi:hypothetical protein